MQHKILVCDDDEDILELIKETLHRENISVITVETGETCLKKAESSNPDLIILDQNLPDMCGTDVHKILKKEKTLSHIPVMILTGEKKSDSDVVSGFRDGACDYMTKPFEPKILVARVKNILRWLDYKGKLKEIVKKCGLEMDVDQRRIKVNGKIVDLTQKEFDLISILVRNSGRVLSRQHLLETVWGYEDMASVRTLISHISTLKKKLGPHCAKKIVTVKGKGYKLDT